LAKPPRNGTYFFAGADMIWLLDGRSKWTQQLVLTQAD
jgi:hypothetical protein